MPIDKFNEWYVQIIFQHVKVTHGTCEKDGAPPDAFIYGLLIMYVYDGCTLYLKAQVNQINISFPAKEGKWSIVCHAWYHL